jgi:MoaD family protein
MTTVRVRLFAALRELAGAREVEAEGATAGDILDALGERYGERFATVARAGSIVVDGERASAATRLTGAEEVAILPPVSGGGAPRLNHGARGRPCDTRGSCRTASSESSSS